MTEQKSRRGGYRPGAGRKRMPGDLQRRDACIEAELIDLAVYVGHGEFSAGLRELLRYAQRLYRRDVARELPPTNQPVLALCGLGWNVAEFGDDGTWRLSSQLASPVELPDVSIWCFLQPTPEEAPIIPLPITG